MRLIFRAPWVPLALALSAIIIVYQIGYQTFPAVPGNDPRLPIGWWGWCDQGLYLKSSIALWQGDFSADKHYYMPLYPFLGSLLLGVSPQHSYYVPDLLLMVGFAALFIRLVSRYVGAWSAVIALLAGMLLYSPLRTQWLIPWTSTLSALLFISAFFLLDRYLRLRANPEFKPRTAALNAALFGLAIGAQTATRAIDVVTMAPIALVYAGFLLRDLVYSQDSPRGRELASVLAGGVGFLVPFLGWLAFNHATYGAAFGGTYYAAAESYGFVPSALGKKLFSHLLDSHVFFVERKQDWLSQLPLFALALAFLPAILISAPIVFRVTALVAVVQFAIYYSYSDIVPTGTFRFNNIHYFKWLAPMAFAMAIYVLQGLFTPDEVRQKSSRRGLAIAAVSALAALSVTARYQRFPLAVLGQDDHHAVFSLPETKLDFIDMPRVRGKWEQPYFAKIRDVSLDDGRSLATPRDYRFIPFPGGTRLLFTRPQQAQKVTIDIGDEIRFSEALEGRVQGVAVHFRPGLLLSQRRAPDWSAPVYDLGGILDFPTSGSAELYLGEGWSGGEPWGRWIDGDGGDMRLRLGARPKDDLLLHLMAGGFVSVPAHPQTATDISANHCPIGRLGFDREGSRAYVLRIPAVCVDSDGRLRLAFHNLTPASPKSLGLSGDPRQLGIGVVSLRLEPAAAEPAARTAPEQR